MSAHENAIIACPVTGELLSSPAHHSLINEWRENSIRDGDVWRYNPFNGIRRTHANVANDPYGRMIVANRQVIDEPEIAAWKPYLKERADGVEGHYCIARRNPDKRCHEFWTGKKWGSAGKVYIFNEEASEREADTVKYWRNDAVRAAAEIAERYGEKHIAEDIRKLHT